MTNYEHYKEQIEKIARMSIKIAVTKGGEVDVCETTNCKDCEFYDPIVPCAEMTIAWADEECKEPEVDWSKVPVDTKIYVCDTEYDEWIPRHFAKYEDDYVYAWDGGCTSFTTNESSKCEYAELAEE